MTTRQALEILADALATPSAREARPMASLAGRNQTLHANATSLRGRGVNFDEAAVSAVLYPTQGRSIQATPMSSRDTGVGTNEPSGGTVAHATD